MTAAAILDVFIIPHQFLFLLKFTIIVVLSCFTYYWMFTNYKNQIFLSVIDIDITAESVLLTNQLSVYQ